MMSIWCCYCSPRTYFITFSSVSVIDFEQVHISWESCWQSHFFLYWFPFTKTNDKSGDMRRREKRFLYSFLNISLALDREVVLSITIKFGSSHRRCSLRNGVLKHLFNQTWCSSKFTGKHLRQSLFFNKLAGLSLKLY